MNTLLPAIEQRRSVRQFLSDPVESDKLDLLLEAARLAPSSINLQHIRVLVVQSHADLQAVRSACYGASSCTTAPLVLLCMADLSQDNEAPVRIQELVQAGLIGECSEMPRTHITGRQMRLKLGSDMALVNAAIAVEHIVLQAQHMGLGSCWVHHFDHGEVRQHFKLPEHLALLTLLPVGYAAQTPGPRPIRSSILYEPGSA